MDRKGEQQSGETIWEMGVRESIIVMIEECIVMRLHHIGQPMEV